MDRHPGVGLAGSRLEDPDGTPQCSAFRFITAATEFVSALRLGIVSKLMNRWVVAPPIPDEPRPADWLAGASLIVRRSVFEEIGLLDPSYFLYFEEVDFCLRARRAGWRCWYVPASRVVHLVGSATGVSETRRKPPRRPAYWFDSRRRYFIKNFGPLHAAAADAAWLLGYSLWRVRRLIQRKPDLDPPRLGRDFVRNSVFFKGFRLAS
jgi:N-acetylglucosaminyl-diphospho-decaprenol L-rhamnosyltransferase